MLRNVEAFALESKRVDGKKKLRKDKKAKKPRFKNSRASNIGNQFLADLEDDERWSSLLSRMGLQ